MQPALTRPIRLGKPGPRVFPLIAALAARRRAEQRTLREFDATAHLARDIGLFREPPSPHFRLSHLPF